MNELPTTIVIFGASGDLTQRKLVPALYNLLRKKRLPANTRIVGFARRPYSDQEFRNRLQEGVAEFSADTYDESLWEKFAPSLQYFRGDLTIGEDFTRLHDYLHKIKQLGFSDKQLASLLGKSDMEIYRLRKKKKILPTYKLVDTCGAEFEAYTPYYYSTYEKENEARF